MTILRVNGTKALAHSFLIVSHGVLIRCYHDGLILNCGSSPAFQS